MLRQEVRLTSLRPDRGKINHSIRTRRFQCGAQCHSDRLRLRKLWARIKVWRYQHKDAFCPLKRRGEGNRILIVASATSHPQSAHGCPLQLPDNRADRLPCGEKRAGDDTPDLTGDSHDCIINRISFAGSERDD